MDEFLKGLSQSFIPEIVCLVTQASLTLITIIRLRDNQDDFPIKQLGPKTSMTIVISFLLSNLLCLAGRIIENANGYYNDTTACRTQHLQLYILGIFFNISRQLPFTLFAIKLLRVSMCFWPPFNRMYVEQINKRVIAFFRSEAYMIFFSILYVVILNTLIVAIYGQSDYNSNYFFYEYMCPREFNSLEVIVSGLRILSLGVVFFLSLWTYDELDFKKFLFLIFLTSNLTLIPKILTYFFEKQSLDYYTREGYYITFLVMLLDTVIMAYCSGVGQQLNQPAMQGVLQSWEAFHNLKLGMVILEDFALWKDDTSPVNYNYRCLESFTFLDSLIKLSRVDENFKLDDYMQVIEKILQRNQLLKVKLGSSTSVLRAKCRNGTLQIKDVKKIQKILSDYCQLQLFNGWKKTHSYRYLKKQFINNGDINEKLDLFGIPIS